MAAIQDPVAVDGDKLEQFVFRAVEEVGATLNAALVVMGDKLGLYRTLAGAGPLTAVQLARMWGGGADVRRARAQVGRERALRPRMAERAGSGRLRRVRRRIRQLHAPAGAG